MGKLPDVNGREVVAALLKVGWTFDRQSGSHMVLIKEGQLRSLSVPNHRTIAKGTLRSILRTAGLSVDEFLGLL